MKTRIVIDYTASSAMTNDYHGKVISYTELATIIPKRRDFIDSKLSDKVNADLESQKIMFMPSGVWDDKPLQLKQYGKSCYQFLLFGILEDGRKATVMIDGILPYFEVKIPDEISAKGISHCESFASRLFDELEMEREDYFNFMKTINRQPKEAASQYWKLKPKQYEIVSGKPLKYYQEHQSSYMRIYFEKTAYRKDAILYVRSKGLETAHDDLTCYYRVVCRDYLLSIAKWLVINNFTVTTSSKYVKGLVLITNIAKVQNFEGELNEVHLLRDNTLTMCWDIETFREINDGKLPSPNCKDDCLFMIGITFQWHMSNEQLLRICLVDVPCNPDPDFLTVVCDTEENIIKAFADFYESMTPEFVLGFNDAGYDWPWVIERAKSYPGLLTYCVDKMDMMINQKMDDQKALYNYQKICVKIEAELNVDGHNFQLNGYVPADVMIAFRQMPSYKTSEQYSLNFFLADNKLGTKEDMPYHEMFRIYRVMRKMLRENLDPADLKSQMTLVAKYCVVDAQRCHELMKKRVVISDRREIANGSYTSMSDAFYRADGMKVRNLVIARGQLKGLKISNISNEIVQSGKYPGAWVFPPVKGLMTSKLSIEERIQKARLGFKEYEGWLTKTEDDIAELKSHIAQYGPCFDPSDIESDEKYDEVGKIHAPDGPRLPVITDEDCTNMLKEQMYYPITGLDFASLYPSIIMACNLSPEYIVLDKQYAKKLHAQGHVLHRICFQFQGQTVKGWSIRHDNKLDPSKPDYKFGLFPAILKELFDARKKLKKGDGSLSGPTSKGLIYWEKYIEDIDAGLVTPGPSDVSREDAEFYVNSIDSKQRAVKVFMNTFYGESGNKRSSLFLLQIAGGITSAGQYYIKKAYDFVLNKGCRVYYGDSVPGDSPVILKFPCGKIDVCTIDSIPYEHSGFEWKSYKVKHPESEACIEEITICDGVTIDIDDKWIPYPQFKSGADGIRLHKQQHAPKKGLQIWTTSGWKRIHRVIRHKTVKDMYQIATSFGAVEVTEDHSLLTFDKKALTPVNATIGTCLYRAFPSHKSFSNLRKYEWQEITINEAYTHGFFHDTLHLRFAINQICKRVPTFILNSNEDIRKAYFQGLCNGKNVSKEDLLSGKYEIMLDGKLNAQSVYLLMRSLNIKATIMLVEENTYCITREEYKYARILNISKKESKFDYVYDIETEDGSFLTGVGQICVSNTDSIYLSMPESSFTELDKSYYSGRITKLDYWEKLVETTFKVLKPLNEEVNEMLRELNGTEFLKMAYEEVLWPVLFAAKKKYVGVKHVNIPNFGKDMKLFIKGLELKKRGVSKVLKTVCMDIIYKSMSVNNVLTMIEAVEDKIKEIYNTDWSNKFEDFIMTVVYKPSKQNVRAHTFRQRMMDERKIEIKPGERVKFVIVKKYPFTYDTQGRKHILQVGDKMEIAEIAEEEGMKIDLDYYVSKSIAGQLARFITYHPWFYIAPNDYSDKEDVKKADEKTLKRARKYIEQICSEHYTKYFDKGAMYKNIYKYCMKLVNTRLQSIFAKYRRVLTVLDIVANKDIDNVTADALIKKAKAFVEERVQVQNFGKIYIELRLCDLKGKERDDKIIELQRIYYSKSNKNNFIDSCEKKYEERHVVLETRLKKNLSEIGKILDINSNLITKIVNYVRAYMANTTVDVITISYEEEEELNMIIDDEIDNNLSVINKCIDDVLFYYTSIISNYEYITKMRSIVKYLKDLGIKKLKVFEPVSIERDISSLSEDISDSVDF